jgi:hypothetical protein
VRPRVGRTLTRALGAWEGTVPIRYAYAWVRNGRVMSRVSGHSYRVVRSDVGSRLARRVTATNAARSVTVTSAPVRVRK